MLHLIDANVLITAHRLYYSLDRVPEFWEWLLHMGNTDQIKMPIEMIEEVTAGTDDLARWLAERHNRDALSLAEEADITLVRRVVNEGYAPDLTDIEIEKIGRDPFLIATGLRDSASRLVVTTEISRPRALRANRKIPDVCNHFGLRCIDSFGLIRALNFSTSWRRGP